jgi:hypothetical protein
MKVVTDHPRPHRKNHRFLGKPLHRRTVVVLEKSFVDLLSPHHHLDHL